MKVQVQAQLPKKEQNIDKNNYSCKAPQKYGQILPEKPFENNNSANPKFRNSP